MSIFGARSVVAFESARESYSDRPVDLYNSGVNQLLSLAAARGYSLRHFCMADLYEDGGSAAVRSRILELGTPHRWTLDDVCGTGSGPRRGRGKRQRRGRHPGRDAGRRGPDRPLVDSLRTGFAPYELGISVAENVPYSGGFIIRKHHDPSAGVHAIQMEVTMDTYMYEADAAPNRRFALKQQRLDIIRSVLREAIETTCQAGLPLGREGAVG